MTTIEALTTKVIAFRDERDWKQFHAPKDVAISLILEAGEVLEHFQWKTPEETEAYVKGHRDEIGNELSDVLYHILLLAHDLDIPIGAAFTRKMAQNAKKYPVKLSKGNHLKYTAHQDAGTTD